MPSMLENLAPHFSEHRQAIQNVRRCVMSSLRKYPFLLALRRWGCFALNVPSGEERGETDAFAGYVMSHVICNGRSSSPDNTDHLEWLSLLLIISFFVNTIKFSQFFHLREKGRTCWDWGWSKAMQIFNILFQLLSYSLKSDTIDTNGSAKEKK